MTHILIPIKDIEQELKILQLNRQKKINSGFLNDAQAIQNQILVYKEILLGKQISLNEEDIKAKAQGVIDILLEPTNGEELCAYFGGIRVGYEQALKDLL